MCIQQGGGEAQSSGCKRETERKEGKRGVRAEGEGEDGEGDGNLGREQQRERKRGIEVWGGEPGSERTSARAGIRQQKRKRAREQNARARTNTDTT